MSISRLENIKACVFDAYGTLFDVHSAVGKYRERLGENSERISALWRTKQLEYTWLRSLMRRHADFWQVTQDALDYALDASGIDDRGLRDDLMNTYLHLDCYPEVPEMLRRLTRGGLRTAILSNGSPTMLKAAVEHTGLADVIDLMLSIEQVGIYKPDPRVYRLAVDRLALDPKAISFQSANAWDAAGASAVGLRVVWVNRSAQRPERLPFAADAEIKSLDELPALLGV